MSLTATDAPFGVPGTPLSAWQASQALGQVPPISVDQLVPANTRLVVAAPHPDDEILACGGLLASLAGRVSDITLISVTDGDGSHPGSAQWPPARLRDERRRESTRALTRLGFDTRRLRWRHLALPDGRVAEHASALREQLLREVSEGDRLLVTWRSDGHCDHETLGEVAAHVAQVRGAVLIETPVWAWHWAEPEDPRLPWDRARKLWLTPQAHERKQSAIAEHATQLASDPSTGAPPVLSPATLERLLQPFELVFL